MILIYRQHKVTDGLVLAQIVMAIALMFYHFESSFCWGRVSEPSVLEVLTLFFPMFIFPISIALAVVVVTYYAYKGWSVMMEP
jgi:hypothetical protein